MTTTPHDKALLPCPFCGGEAQIDQTGRYELTLRCVGVQPSGLLGCGPKLVQKITQTRFTLDWLAERMTETWNRRSPVENRDSWVPIDRADKSIDRIIEAAGLRIGNSEEYWVRDADGRAYQAVWSDDGRKSYWWDLEGESPVDPIEFMPHPLDRRFSSIPSHEGREK